MNDININYEQITMYEITWFPNPELRESKLRIQGKSRKSIERLVTLLNQSKKVTKLRKSALIEGFYKIKLLGVDSLEHNFELDGGRSIYSLESDCFYKNDFLLLFVYQKLFDELLAQNIKIE